MSVVLKSLPAPVSVPANSKRLLALVVGGALLFSVLWYAAPQESAVVEPVDRSLAKAGSTRAGSGDGVSFAARAAAKVGNDLFSSHSWYVPPPPPPPTPREAPVAPSAPPLPYTFLGSYIKSGDKPVYFLVRGDRVFDVRSGDTLENTYAVGDASRGRLQLTYLPLKQDQWLSVGSPQ
jgi:hypothetical protein